MPTAQQETVTRLLDTMVSGDPDAADRLTPIVYEQLRAMAGAMLRDQRAGHTLQPTALVNEAYLRLHSSLDELKPTTVRQFFGLAALEIRRTLLDVVRKLTTRSKEKKQGRAASIDTAGPDGGRIDVPIDDEVQKRFDLTESLFAAVDKLPPDLQEVVMLLHFQGLTQAEVAGLYGVHEDTVKKWWASARRQLAGHLSAFDPNAAE